MTPENALNAKSKRIHAIDILRGLVILLMLVDHTRERFFLHEQVTDPMQIDATSTSLFFTRLTAHFCAPIFVFLTGLSAWLYAHPRQKPQRSASGFLFKRGLFLILLEVTLINFSWFGSYQALYLQVMWAIGLSMIALALLVKMPRYLIGVLGLLIVFGHNALTPISFTPEEWMYPIWTILHDRGYLIQDAMIPVKISYPLLPWIGVIALGYFAGPVYDAALQVQQRYKWLLGVGVSSLILLLILRGFNIYGETLPWEQQQTVLETVSSFLNFTKYPPSLDFILLTLGVGALLLYVFERFEHRWMLVLKTFGSVPMFFYIVHLYVLLLIYAVGVQFFGTNKGDYLGVDHVWMVWAIAAVLAFLLYWPTKWFSAYKKASSATWIKYF